MITNACFPIGSRYVRHDVAPDQLDPGIGETRADHAGEPMSHATNNTKPAYLIAQCERGD